MVAGLILGWLWLRAESIWLVANAHGALNNWGQYAVTYMKESVTPDTDMAALGAVSQALLVVRNSSALARCRIPALMLAECRRTLAVERAWRRLGDAGQKSVSRRIAAAI